MNFTQLLSQHLGLDKKPQDQKIADIQASLFKPTLKQLKARMQRVRERAKSGFKRVFSEQELQSNVFYQASNISSNNQITTLYQDFKRLSLPITQKSGFEQFLAMTKLYVVLIKLQSNKISKNSAIQPPTDDDIAIWNSLIDDSNLSKKEHDQVQNCALKIFTRQMKISQIYKSQNPSSNNVQRLKDKICSPQQVLKSLNFEHVKKTLTTQWLFKPVQEEQQLPPLQNPVQKQQTEVKSPQQDQKQQKQDKGQQKKDQEQPEYIDVSQLDPDKVNWFKHIVDNCIPKSSNLHNPSMLAFLLERLVSNKSQQQLQGELIDLMGDENFDLLFQLFQRRQYIKKLTKRITDVLISKKQKQSGMHNQAQVGVTVTYATVKGKKRNQKKKKENDKRGDVNNLDLLIQLGFPKDFVYENNKLGLKKHQNKMNQNFQGDVQEDQDQKEDFMQQYGMFGTQQSIIPVKRQLGVQIVSDNYNYKHYKIQAVPRKEFPEQACLLIEESFPEWARPTFSSSKVKILNPIQSEVYQTAFKSNSNMLVCAPTGAGKTNIALMTVLRQISHFTSIESQMSLSPGLKQSNYNLSHHTFTLIYVAPMKALVSQIVEKFTKALSYLHLRIRECTGDMQLSRAQIAETHLIVTTPEKWDVISRKSQNAMSQVRLIIMDEIHLLNQDRGSVLQCLVARAMRTSEHTQLPIRLVGLSATLPNYRDVAKFMMAEESATFFFDNSYRPTPLQYEFYGLKNSNNSQRQRNLQTDITFNIAKKAIYAGKQVLIFVHTRNQTIKTSDDLIQKMQTDSCQTLFVGENAWQYTKKIDNSNNQKLKKFFKYGLGIHNAGMLRKDRNLSEQLFESGSIKALVTTSTLAWGVNLPAHTVIIKGTQFYDPSSQESGGWRDIGIFDVQQIFGRAGRPQYDNQGTGVIITSIKKMDDYVRSLARQNSVESNMHKKLDDSLNAEIAIGTVTSLTEAVQWLKFTYLSHRLLQNPVHYGFSGKDAYQGVDKLLFNMIQKTATKLHNIQMIRYNSKKGFLSPTALGRVACNYYISVDSMAEFNQVLKPGHSFRQILMVFAKGAKEFKSIQSRKQEQNELSYLLSEVPKELVHLKNTQLGESYSKVLILYAHYIMGTQLRAFSLIADTNYIIQNSLRILRGLFQIALVKNQAELSRNIHFLALLLEKRLLPSSSQLYQFTAWSNLDLLTMKGSGSKKTKSQYGLLRDHIVHHLQQMGVTKFTQVYELDETLIKNLIPNKGQRDEFNKLMSHVPKLEIRADVRPITHSILQIKMQIEADFKWNDRWNGKSQDFRLIVDHGDQLLHTDLLSITKKDVELFQKLKAQNDQGKIIAIEEKLPNFNFFLPFQGKQDDWPYYNLTLISQKWIGAEYSSSINLKDLNIPDQKSPQTPLLKLHPLPKSALQNPDFQSLYSSFEFFNPIQTQVFHTLYHTDINSLIGAPTGSGKTIMSELAILRTFKTDPNRKVIYIAPLKALAKERLIDWSYRFGTLLKKRVLQLTGDYTPDLIALQQANIIITTPQKWDGISRNWSHRNYVQQVSLMIIDEIHLLGQDRGPVLQVIVSRMRYIADRMKQVLRIIGLSTALANAQDVSSWLGIKEIGLYNFKPSVRPVPVRVFIDGFQERAYCPRMATMNKPAYHAIQNHSPNHPVLVFVSSRRQTRLTALDLISYCASEGFGSERQFLNMDLDEIEKIADEGIKDENLKHTIVFGIGMHHAGLVQSDRKIVQCLFVERKIQVLVTTSTLAWGVNFPARLVIIKGTEFYDVKTHKYIDMPITDILQMMGRAGRPQFDTEGIAVLYVQQTKKNFYKKFLYEPFPVQSSLPSVLVDHLNAQIAAGTLTTKQSCMDYLTWTYFTRRLVKNPAYYGVDLKTQLIRQQGQMYGGYKDIEDQKKQIESLKEFLDNLIDTSLIKLKEAGCIDLQYGSEQSFNLASKYNQNNKIQDKKLKKVFEQKKKNDMVDETYLNKFNKDQKRLIPTQSAIFPTFFGHLASFYYLSYKTVAFFSSVLTADNANFISYPQLIYIISNAEEFNQIPQRHNQDILNEALAQICPIKYSSINSALNSVGNFKIKADYESPNFKTFLLLQAHFSQLPLPIADYITDTKSVLDQAMRVVQAMIDICAKMKFLNLSLMLINMSQMIIQGAWMDSNALRNLGDMGSRRAQKLANAQGITHLQQLINILSYEKKKVDDLLSRVGLDEKQVKQSIGQLKSVPRVNVNIGTVALDQDLKPQPGLVIKKETQFGLIVKLKKTNTGFRKAGEINSFKEDEQKKQSDQADQEEEFSTRNDRVRMHKFSKVKDASWYLVVGQENSGELLALKRIILRQRCQKTLQIQLPFNKQIEDMNLKFYLMSDSYIGIDQEKYIYLGKGIRRERNDQIYVQKEFQDRSDGEWVYESDDEKNKIILDSKQQ